jgi:acyl-CoA dehydrogenase
MGLVALGYMWCRIVEAALVRLAVDPAAERMRGKLATGRFFVERMLPETALHLARIRLGGANLMELPAQAF